MPFNANFIFYNKLANKTFRFNFMIQNVTAKVITFIT